MKGIYLFSTKVKMYWVLLPMILIFVLAIVYNPYATNWLKLYPLMLLSVAGVVFVFIFYFRLIRIDWTEIKDIGRFSPRDSALINEGKTLVLIPERRGRVRVYLYGCDGLPELDWMRDQTTDPSVICLYRGRTQGGRRAVKRVLSYFGVAEADIPRAISEDEFQGQYENVNLTVSPIEDGRKKYVIDFTRTV